MHIDLWVWIVTIAAALAFLGLDIFLLGRSPHRPTIKESVRYLAVLLAATAVFAVGVWILAGHDYGSQFVVGWLTEYSLSIDNLFIFMIIMAKFGIPDDLQEEALTTGIVIALVLRGLFIAVGAAAINAFSWVFYIFGAFLVYTAVKLAIESRNHSDDKQYEEGRLIRFMRNRLPATDEFHGTHLSVKKDGKRLFTPMAFVILALGTTDLLFALDSIPAIYGLTQQPYLVLTANIFALLGLRQLFFLIGGLLRKLVYLSLGLSVLLAFIGAKLVLHALHENTLPFLNGGEHIGWAPDIPTWVSLAVIIGVLAVTAVASLLKTSRDRRRTVAAA